MKKILTIFLTMILTFSLTACGTKNNEKFPDNQDTNDATNDTQDTNDDTNQTTPSVDGWGLIDAKTVRNENGVRQIFFSWPVNLGEDAYTSKVALQNDGTVVMVDNYVPGHSPEIDSIDNVFPAYFDQIVKSFSSYYGSEYSDGSFTIEDTEIVTIKGYKFYKYHGKHNYIYDGENCSEQYVIYLTTMKMNGAYLYFLASDVTADQSAADKMEENVYNMILSFREAD